MLAHAFEDHWDACLSELEDRAIKARKQNSEPLQQTLAMLGAAVANLRPNRPATSTFVQSHVPGRHVAFREAPAPRTPSNYTGAELRKGSVAAYAGPPPPRGVCRRWWYDGVCAKAGCFFVATHTAENAGKGDPAP